MTRSFSPESLLRVLDAHGVELIIVGGVAAILSGAPYSTFDLDVVHRRTPENIVRLLGALRELHALFADPAGRRIEPNETHLWSGGTSLLSTDHGRLDLLGELHDGRAYDQLLEHTDVVTVGTMSLRVLSLEELIRVKTAAGRAKDRLALPLLVVTLENRRNRDA